MQLRYDHFYGIVRCIPESAVDGETLKNNLKLFF